jgi:hypothetical protein
MQIKKSTYEIFGTHQIIFSKFLLSSLRLAFLRGEAITCDPLCVMVIDSYRGYSVRYYLHIWPIYYIYGIYYI